MGSAAPSKPVPKVVVISSKNIEQSDVVETSSSKFEVSKETSSDLKSLALGGTSPQRSQSREYDRKINDSKKSRQFNVDWNEAKITPDDRNPSVKPPTSTSTSTSTKKYPESNLTISHQSPSKRPLPPNSKPKPPSSSPSQALNSRAIGHSIVYAPDKISTSMKISCKSNGPFEETRSHRDRDVSESSRALGTENVSKSQPNIDQIKQEKSSYMDSFNVLGTGQDYDSDSDYSCGDDGGVSAKDSGGVYDWISSNTPRSQRDGDVKGDNPSGTQNLVEKDNRYMLSLGGADDDLWTDGTAAKIQRKPDNIPRLNIPSQYLSAGTPPQKRIAHQTATRSGAVSKPHPPPRVGIPNQSPAGSTHLTSSGLIRGAPVPRPQHINITPSHRGPSPILMGAPLFADASQRGYAQQHHEVKETKDVKRNRAQLPSTLTHAKPTTGDWLKKRYIVNNYILLDVLGTGSYGEVRLCKDRTTDHLFAVKILSKEMLKKKKGGNTTETYFEDIKREIAIMKKLQHPNVLKLFEVLDDPKVNKMYLVLEYMKRGDLLNFIKLRDEQESKEKRKNSKTFIPLSDAELWVIFKEVVAGVRYLHLQNIVHGDIKPQNILVGEDGIVKIADFGISKMLENGSAQKLVDAAGTPAFMSPELCSAEASFSGQLADIWAIGATMFMLRFGTPPFVASNLIGLYYKIINDPLEFPPVFLDPGLRNLLINMLEKDPNLRYSMDQVVTHPWLRVAPAAKKISDMRDVSQDAPLRSIPSTLQYTKKYEDEEAAAMNGPVKTVDKDDMFRSIGVGLGKIRSDDEEDGADHDPDEIEDIMASNWALDVFEKVDDDDIDSDDDEDEDGDEDTVKESPKRAEAKPPHSAKEVPSNRPRTDMEEKEEDRRSQEFKKKFVAKSSQKNVLSSEHRVQFGNVSNMEDSSRETSFRGLDREASLGYLGEPVEEISMNDFEKMMDTLAMRPVSTASVDSDDASSSLLEGDFFAPSCAKVSPQRYNHLNGTAGVSHSEQGCRKSQEDRCVVAMSLLEALQGESLNLDSKERDYLSLVTLGAVFDGHSGQKCAEYMTESICKQLVIKPHFYNIRTQHAAITESFHDIDRQICDILRDGNDSSGSTGTVVLYDGRSRLLTVASVGDSQCVLCRSGKAVKIHSTHRVGESPAETERIIAAGGSIVNKRVNGVLAISRAFGDTAFKDLNYENAKSPVVATPEITSELVTPMTEFCVIASDGLWDVVDSQWVVNFIRRKIKVNISIEDICRGLADEAIEKGSIDNVSAVIIMFHMNADKKQFECK